MKKLTNHKKPLVPYFLGISPYKYAKLFLWSLLIFPMFFLWAEKNNYSIVQINNFLLSTLVPLSIAFLIVPILYIIHFIFYRDLSNRSEAYAKIALKYDLDYTAKQGLIVPALREVISDINFHSFYGINKGSENYIIDKNPEPIFYMFDYGYPVQSRNWTYTFFKTVFIFNCAQLKLPQFQIRPAGLIDFIFRKNKKNELPKSYANVLSGYYFWYNKKEFSIEDVIKALPKEIFSIISLHNGMIIEYFSHHLVLNFDNCRIPNKNLSIFFKIGVLIKTSLFNTKTN